MNELISKHVKFKSYSSYDNILLLVDFNFNMSFSNKNMKCIMFELNHLTKGPTCFKSSNPSCIDNLYPNKKRQRFLIIYYQDWHF